MVIEEMKKSGKMTGDFTTTSNAMPNSSEMLFAQSPNSKSPHPKSTLLNETMTSRSDCENSKLQSMVNLKVSDEDGVDAVICEDEMDEEEKEFLNQYFDSELKQSHATNALHRDTDIRTSLDSKKILRASELQDALKRRATETMLQAKEKIKK